MRSSFCRGTLLAFLTTLAVGPVAPALRATAPQASGDNQRGQMSTWYPARGGRTETPFSNGRTNLQLRCPRGIHCTCLQAPMTTVESTCRDCWEVRSAETRGSASSSPSMAGKRGKARCCRDILSMPRRKGWHRRSMDFRRRQIPRSAREQADSSTTAASHLTAGRMARAWCSYHALSTTIIKKTAIRRIRTAV